MPRVKVGNIGTAGFLTDQHPSRLGNEVWTGAKNVHFDGLRARSAKGWGSFYGDTNFAPWWLTHFAFDGDEYWVYLGSAKAAYVVDDGSGAPFTHTDITNAGGDYSSDTGIGWAGTYLNGMLVVTNGVDAPQFLNTTSIAAFADLTNWPASTTAKAIRTYKNFLFAFDVTQSGTDYPFRLLWSHPADPGTVPSSWDPADATKLAGWRDFAETGTPIVDGLAFQDSFMIYKNDQIFSATLTNASSNGVPFVFNFKKVAANAGVIGRNCIVELEGAHFVFGQGDLFVNTGGAIKSLLSGTVKRWFEGKVDFSQRHLCFNVYDPTNKEILFCFPQVGDTYATTALVWNKDSGGFTVRDLPQSRHAYAGSVVIPQLQTSLLTNTFSDDYRAISLTAFGGSVKLKRYRDTEYISCMYLSESAGGLQVHRWAQTDITTTTQTNTAFLNGGSGGTTKLSRGDITATQTGDVVFLTSFIDYQAGDLIVLRSITDTSNFSFPLHAFPGYLEGANTVNFLPSRTALVLGVDTNDDLNYFKSTDEGVTFGNEILIESVPLYAAGEFFSYSSGTVFLGLLAYLTTGGSYKIRTYRTIDEGANWVIQDIPIAQTMSQYWIGVDLDSDGVLHLLVPVNTTAVFYMFSTDLGIQWVPQAVGEVGGTVLSAAITKSSDALYAGYTIGDKAYQFIILGQDHWTTGTLCHTDLNALSLYPMGMVCSLDSANVVMGVLHDNPVAVVRQAFLNTYSTSTYDITAFGASDPITPRLQFVGSASEMWLWDYGFARGIVDDDNTTGDALVTYVERRFINLTEDDSQHIKYVKSVYPIGLNEAGGDLSVYIGTSSVSEQDPVWHGPYTHDLNSVYRMDSMATGRWISIRFESNGRDISWELFGYSLEFEIQGEN